MTPIPCPNAAKPSPSPAVEPTTPSSSRPTPQYPSPLLRLHIQDLALHGARSFLTHADPATILSDAVTTVLHLLYPVSTTTSAAPWPGTRSITLILEAMGGVAYTTGKSLDSDHKEIHFSTTYIGNIPLRGSPTRIADEIKGVVVHEMVHCWQQNAYGTAPGGLIEGIADWVRLRANLAPPHWTREADGDWDAGYQHTAYFLDYLEDRFGHGTVPRMNESLRHSAYDERAYWKHLFGSAVGELWTEYGKWLEGQSKGGADEAKQVLVGDGNAGGTISKDMGRTVPWESENSVGERRES